MIEKNAICGFTESDWNLQNKATLSQIVKSSHPRKRQWFAVKRTYSFRLHNSLDLFFFLHVFLLISYFHRMPR